MPTDHSKNHSHSENKAAPGLAGVSFRMVLVAIFALLLMGVWIEYAEIFNAGGPFAENSPPNSAVCVVLVLFGIGWLLFRLRHWLRLGAAEMIFVYCTLLVAAPLMTQGMWHRIFGLLAAIPHNGDFSSYESLPEILWPHGKNLCRNGRFEKGLEGYEWRGDARPEWQPIEWRGRKRPSPLMAHRDRPEEQTVIRFVIPCRDADGWEQLVAGENFLFSFLVKAEGFQPDSYYFVRMQADDGPQRTILLSTSTTKPSFSLPGGFERKGVSPLVIPRELKQQLAFEMGLSGPGRLAFQDLQLLNCQAVEGAFSGVRVAGESDWRKLGPHERDFTIVKPDRMFSPAGLAYLARGFIPLGQWLRPAAAWGLLIGALFIGFLGFNVLMRRQWVENERFSFPMNIFPRQLFSEETDCQGIPRFAIFRNRVMWAGFVVTLVLTLLKGAAFYFPGLPSPSFEEIRLDTYVTHPLLKAYFQNVQIGLQFCILAIALLIETELLFSIWAFFLLFQFVFLFGKAFNLGRYPSYPWEFQQAIGSFIGIALVALWIGRKHIWEALKRALGRGDLDESQEMMSYRSAFGLLGLSIAILAAWGAWTGIGMLQSCLFFGYTLVCGFAASKIRAECGAPHGYWTPYYSLMFAGALGGFALFGASGMLTAGIASGFMFVACFLFIAPVQVEMMELGRHFGVRQRVIGWGLVLGLIGGLFIGGFVFLCWSYGFGADNLVCKWSYGQNWYFNGFRAGLSTMDRAVQSGKSIHPDLSLAALVGNPDAQGIGIGFVVVCLLAFLRASFMWFPFNPVGYVLATTYFARGVWFTCLVAWLIRSIVLKIGGAHTIRKGLVPFCVGMFLACAVSIIFFDIVGVYLHSRGIINVYCAWP